MSNPINPGHPGEYLTALQTIMPTGTPIAEVLIQKGISGVTQVFPVLILNCPQVHRIRKANHAKQAIFTIHGLYLDRWETDTRTYEQILTDMQEALCTCADNVDSNPTLNLGPTIAGETIDIRIDSPVDTSQLGVPLVAGELVIEVRGTWYTAT